MNIWIYVGIAFVIVIVIALALGKKGTSTPQKQTVSTTTSLSSKQVVGNLANSLGESGTRDFGLTKVKHDGENLVISGFDKNSASKNLLLASGADSPEHLNQSIQEEARRNYHESPGGSFSASIRHKKK